LATRENPDMSTLQIFAERPPFVRWEERELGFDHDASEKAGRPIPRVLVMACITPHASKDCVEKPAEEWLAQIKSKAAKGEYNPEWVRFFRASYDEWKLGNELPREGTPVKTWQLTTREQTSRLIALGLRIVEDLAAVPDSGLGEIGLDGRYLRDLARNWIQEGKDKGVTARALADANGKIERLESMNAALVARLELLEAEDTEPQRRGPGRPRKEVA
jgi:hypothetical protein